MPAEYCSAARAKSLLATTALFVTIAVVPAGATAQTSVASVCAGVSLPRSVVTDLTGSVLVPVIGGLETTLRTLTLGAVNLGLSNALSNASAGQPITLNVLDVNNNAINALNTANCVAQADSYSLKNAGGLAIGGNSISGLGSTGRSATSGALTAIAIGDAANTALNLDGAIAIGDSASVTGGIASIALGRNSTANGLTLGQQAYLVGGAATSELAIGGRRITGLAAGAADNDAVNVAQLRAATSATASDALAFNAGTQLFDASRNGGPARITGVADGSVTAGSTDAVNGGQLAALDTRITSNATALGTLSTDLTGLADVAVRYDGAGKSVATLGGAGGTRLANLADGTNPTDAVTVRQLGSVAQTATAVANDALRYDNVSASYSASRGGAAQKITGVANGAVTAGSTEAVNGGQLASVDTRVAGNTTAIGTLTTDLNALDNVAIRYDGAGKTVATLGGAGGTRLANLADGIDPGDAATVRQLNGVSQSVQTLAGDALRYDSVSGSYSAARGGIARKLTNVAAGTVSAVSNDAVTGRQLYATNQQIANQGDSITNLGVEIAGLTASLNLVGAASPVRYSSGLTPTVPGGTASQHLTLVGALPGAVALHNVAGGVLGSGSSDAVNGGQLFQFGQSLASGLGGASSFDPTSGQFNTTLSYGGNQYASLQGALDAIDIAVGQAGGGTTTPGGTVRARYFNTSSVAADSQAIGQNSTAIGPEAVARGVASLAIGATAEAVEDGSVAIGSAASAAQGKAVSIGFQNVAAGNGAVAIGDPNYATGDGAVALGRDNQATGIGTIALGDTNILTGDGAVGLGAQNSGVGAGTIVLGTGNQVSGDRSIALGTGNVISGADSFVIGTANQIMGSEGLAIGSNIWTAGVDTLAIGNESVAQNDGAAAFGNRAAAQGLKALALGTDSAATDDYATAVGDGAVASGASVALGSNALSNGYASMALGVGAVANGFASTALGSGAAANQEGSVALGSASGTTRGAFANYSAFGLDGVQNSLGEVAIARNLQYVDENGNLTPLGNRQITGLAAGSADTDAVNVAQLRGVSDRLGRALAQAFGGGAGYDASTGLMVGPSYQLNGVTYASVGEALTGLASGLSGTSAVAGNAVAYDGAGRNVVTFGGAGGTRLANVANGFVGNGSLDAVNGGQLFTLQQDIAGLSTTMAQLQAQGGGTPAQPGSGGPSPLQYADVDTGAPVTGAATNDVALVGANTGTPVGLHNVADGQVAEGSTDAVNGGQLAAVQRSATNSLQYDRTADGSRTNQVTLSGGTPGAPVTIANVAAGVAPTDAVNVGQLSAGMERAVGSANAYTDQKVGELGASLGGIRRDAQASTASAMALSSVPQAYGPGMGVVGMGVGQWGGESAIAIGASKATQDGGFMVKFGASYNTRGDGGAAVGAGFAF